MQGCLAPLLFSGGSIVPSRDVTVASTDVYLNRSIVIGIFVLTGEILIRSTTVCKRILRCIVNMQRVRKRCLKEPFDRWRKICYEVIMLNVTCKLQLWCFERTTCVFYMTMQACAVVCGRKETSAARMTVIKHRYLMQPRAWSDAMTSWWRTRYDMEL